MKTTEEMIEVMQAYVDGKKIERTFGAIWKEVEVPYWNLGENDYRVKEGETDEND